MTRLKEYIQFYTQAKTPSTLVTPEILTQNSETVSAIYIYIYN